MSLIKSTDKINPILKSNPNLHSHSPLKYWICSIMLYVFSSVEYQVYTI